MINIKYYKIKNVEIDIRTTTSYQIQITKANTIHCPIIIILITKANNIQSSLSITNANPIIIVHYKRKSNHHCPLSKIKETCLDPKL